MVLRTFRERALQTLLYELGGLALATPIYGALFGVDPAESLNLILALALAALIWAPLHNALFDWLDWQCNNRVASDRPQRLRVLHALSHETSSVVLSLPILIWLGGHDLHAALLADLGLTLFYTSYAYGFHLAYDRLRPVVAA